MYLRIFSVIACCLLSVAPAISQTSVDFRDAVRATTPATVAVKLDDAQAPLSNWYQAVGQSQYSYRVDSPIYSGAIPVPAAKPMRTAFAVAPELVVSMDVPSEADELNLLTHDGRTLSGRVVVRDHVTGLAAIHVENAGLSKIEIAAQPPSAGTPVLVSWLHDGTTATSKSAMIATEPNADESRLGYSQKLDVALTPEQSGAAIVDHQGKLVGVVVVRGGETICLPTSHVTRIIQAASADESSDLWRGRIGIQIHDGPDENVGALITDLIEGMPAKEAGLEVGDRVLKIGDHDCASYRDVIAAVGMSRAGDEVSVEVRRDSETINQTIKLADDRSAEETTELRVRTTRLFPSVFKLEDGQLVPVNKDGTELKIELPKSKATLYGLQVERSELEKSLQKLEAENARLKQVVESIKKTLDLEESKN